MSLGQMVARAVHGAGGRRVVAHRPVRALRLRRWGCLSVVRRSVAACRHFCGRALASCSHQGELAADCDMDGQFRKSARRVGRHDHQFGDGELIDGLRDVGPHGDVGNGTLGHWEVSIRLSAIHETAVQSRRHRASTRRRCRGYSTAAHSAGARGITRRAYPATRRHHRRRGGVGGMDRYVGVV